MDPLYLDYAATTPMLPEVREAMLPYFTQQFGNPSSLYSYGKAAKAAINKARSIVASSICCQPEEIVFTGSGSESDNLAIKGFALANRFRGRHIITSSIEHHAVLETCRFLESEGFTVTYLPVDKFGMVSPENVRQAIKEDTILISIMQANNEIGTIQPIREIGLVAEKAEVCFHTDAVQTVGQIPIQVEELKVDLLSASAHKFYGPKGVGFLYVRNGRRLTPLIHGGEQENRRRASTENVAGIVGLSRALELSQKGLEQEAEKQTKLRDRLIKGLISTIPQATLNGHPGMRLSNNVNLSFASIDGETAVIKLDEAGICAATRSACNSASEESSHVLQAIGLTPEQAYGSLRFSLGKWTTQTDIDQVLKVVPGVVSRLRELSPVYKKA